MTSIDTMPSDFKRLTPTGVIIAIVGIVGVLAAYQLKSVTVTQLWQSYLYAWIFGMLFSIGCYGFMLLHHMISSSWGRPILRLLEAGAKMLPIMFVLYLPVIFFGSHYLYPWMDKALVASDAILRHRAPYMNQTMFGLRTCIYFIIWTATTFWFSGLTKAQDETGNESFAVWRVRLAAPCFLVFVVTTTLAFVDWVMSLDKHWFSTIYGFWFLDFAGLAGLSMIALTIARQKMSKKEPYNTLVSPNITRDLGNLLLMLTMVWAYFSVSQWIITWSGNLPEEIAFYAARNGGMFVFVGAFDIIFSFFVPFLLLLNGHNKRSPQMLAGVCCLILFMRVVDLFWVVIPATRHPITICISDVFALLAIIGIWRAGYGWWIQQNRVTLNYEDPIVEEALNHAGT